MSVNKTNLPEDITRVTSPSGESSQFLDHLQAKLNAEIASGNFLILQATRAHAFVELPRVRGREIFPRMKEIISAAKNEVLISFYQIEPGSDAEKDLLEALDELNAQARDEKIRVKFLINRKYGPAVFFTKPTPDNNLLKKLDAYPNLDLQYAEHLHGGAGSYHAKMIIVDNEVAMLPSCDLKVAGNYKDHQARWVDMATVLHGQEIVSNARHDFITAWESSNSRVVSGKKQPIPKTLNSSQIDSDHFMQTDAIYLTKKAHGYPTRGHKSPYAIAVLEGINNAKSKIDIATPNFNDPLVIEALARAASRGVFINITMGRNMNDLYEAIPFAGGTNQHGIQELYNAAMKYGCVDKIDVRWATNDAGTEVIGFRSDQKLHAKMVIIDDHIVLAGSSVLDEQSIYHSRESDIVMQSEQIAAEYKNKIFDPIFSKARPVNLDSENLILTSHNRLNEMLHSHLDKLARRISMIPHLSSATKVIRKEQIDVLHEDLKLVKANIKNCENELSAQEFALLNRKVKETESMLKNTAKKQEKSLKTISHIDNAIEKPLQFESKKIEPTEPQNVENPPRSFNGKP